MPKIDKNRKAERIRLVEDAALELFKKKGFHGVGLREIAGAAGVSIGNIYNYFKSKEAIFESILSRLQTAFSAYDQPLLEYIANSRFPEDLFDFGMAVGRMVDNHEDYLTLINIDITEFDGRHVRHQYTSLMGNFEGMLKGRFKKLRGNRSLPGGIDPAMAFTVVYMQFFNYFIVERQIGARKHLGLTDEKAIRAIATIFQKGLQRK